MRQFQFVFASLFLMGIVSCSDDIPSDEGSVTIKTAQTGDNTEKGDSSVAQVSTDVILQSLVGRWELTRQGKDEGPWNKFVEFGADKTVVCEYNVGSNDYKKTTNTVEFENDWTTEDNKLIGHLRFPFCGENRFGCCVEGNQMILGPDEGRVYFTDPTKYFIKVSSE